MDSLTFVDGGRTFTCAVEKQHLTSERWWWFRVSTDDRQRYAPFRAAKGDTAAGVQERIVAFYDNLLARRAEPRVYNRGRPRSVPQPTQTTT
jgi:hypothetical protein